MPYPHAGPDRILDSALHDLAMTTAGGAVAIGSPQTGRRVRSWGAVPGAAEVTAATKFYAGSVMKQVTGVLVAQAVVDGRIDPQDRLVRRMPALPDLLKRIEIRHLLNHTAGLPTSAQLASGLGLRESQLDDVAVRSGIRDLDRLLAEPGEAFVYSNPGYVLLAEMLQALHDAPMSELTQRLFASAGMADTWVGTRPITVLPGFDPPPATSGDGGLWTTGADLLTWLCALDARRFGADVSELTERAGVLNNRTGTGYGWGVGPRQAPGGVTFIHGGSWPGWAAMTVRQPSTRVAVAVLACHSTDDAVPTTARTVHQEVAHLLDVIRPG